MPKRMSDDPHDNDAIYPDEIEIITDEESSREKGGGNAFGTGLEALEEVKAYCHAHPWIRVLSLLSFWLSWFMIGLSIVLLVVAFVSGGLYLFKNEQQNARLLKTWDILCCSMVFTLSCAIGVFSPIYGAALMVVYIALFHPTYLGRVWVRK
jgi:hypothetical protein